MLRVRFLVRNVSSLVVDGNEGGDSVRACMDPVRLEPRLTGMLTLCAVIGHRFIFSAVPLTTNHPPNQWKPAPTAVGSRSVYRGFSVSDYVAYWFWQSRCLSIASMVDSIPSPDTQRATRAMPVLANLATQHRTSATSFFIVAQHRPARRPAPRKVSTSLQDDSSGECASEPVGEGGRASAIALGPFI